MNKLLRIMNKLLLFERVLNSFRSIFVLLINTFANLYSFYVVIILPVQPSREGFFACKQAREAHESLSKLKIGSGFCTADFNS
jgi:hypothetical protein